MVLDHYKEFFQEKQVKENIQFVHFLKMWYRQNK